MSGHTPGPWEYRSQPHDDWGLVRAGRYIICQARDPKVDHLDLSHYRRTKTDPFEANARLISAAPDLLLQLSELLADIGPANSDGWHDSSIHSQWVEQARAAVAKATPPPPAGADDGIA